MTINSSVKQPRGSSSEHLGCRGSTGHLNWIQAVLLAEKSHPHVALVDPTLGTATVCDSIRRLREVWPKTEVGLLDHSVREAYVRVAIECKAMGYWTKHASFERILDAVRHMAAGIPSYCPEVQHLLLYTPEGIRFQASSRQKAFSDLSRRELEVMLNLARGLTVKKCATRLRLAESTVDNHKTRLMKKLGVHKVVDLAVMAVREGLLDEGDV